MYQRPVWVEINLSAIKENIRQIKSLVNVGIKCCAIVKADGYGHGAIAVARAVLDAGADYLAVAILEEAIELRQAGFTAPILILGYTPAYQMSLVLAYNAQPTVCTMETAQALSAVAKKANVIANIHVKIDTGMGRIGVRPEDIGSFAEKVVRLPNMQIEGVYSHFAKADERDKSFAHLQYQRFTAAIKELSDRNIFPPIRHIAASAALIDLPETHCDMVRMGIIQYGVWPSDAVTHRIILQPAMTFKCEVAFIKEVPAETPVSYGCTYKTKQSARIATLPVGYADGWNRLLSNKGQVLIHGKLVPVIGRVCMDQCMVDITDIPDVKVGDEVVLFGAKQVPIENVAKQVQSIPYEVMCAISKRVPRVYVNSSQE
jgi:alanine racemase